MTAMLTNQELGIGNDAPESERANALADAYVKHLALLVPNYNWKKNTSPTISVDGRTSNSQISLGG